MTQPHLITIARLLPWIAELDLNAEIAELDQSLDLPADQGPCYLLADDPQTLRRVHVAGDQRALLRLAVAGRHAPAELEAAGADFVLPSPQALCDMLRARPVQASVSIVLLAYNEAESIAAAIVEARRFGALFFSDTEIVVVDDGSQDQTRARIAEVDRGDVTLVTHSTNLGMGASMKDGYLAARGDYIVHLPGDRQVRPSALAPMLAHLAPEHLVVSDYRRPHAGATRAIVSRSFRWLLARVGGLTVDFAGTYIFHRRWLAPCAVERINCRTFVFSFVLLARLAAQGLSLRRVTIESFARDAGQSRVFNLRRTALVAKEIAGQRFRELAGD
ncbi:MAG: glycosyltransferase family 2 protein [Deltaproteobacteria bacterium]|nr:glycosyltransferase family 2 protein [Deltaproteobacteria bacterium]